MSLKNVYKWPSTELFISYLHKHKLHLEELIKMPIHVMEKFDGTNVGIDNDGNIYGRNYMIDVKEKYYQRIDLKSVKDYRIPVEKLKGYFSNMLACSDFKCIVYGELMCNPEKYTTYSTLPTYCPFGVVLTNLNKDQIEEIRSRFSVGVVDVENNLIVLCMSEALHGVLEQHGFRVAGDLGCFDTFIDFIEKQKNWFMDGLGEGVIISLNSTLLKLKIGSEKNFTNMGALTSMKDMPITDKTRQILSSLIDIQNSKLRNGAIVETVKCEKKPKKQENIKDQVILSAIESAMTKFDHEDTYYEKGVDGFKAYVNLIYEESLTDTPDLKKHTVEKYIGIRYGQFKKKKA